MAIFRTLGLSSVAATLAAALIVPVGIATPTPAFAQKGSRLCGWTAEPAQGVAIGLLYEARTKDASYGKQCSVAISDIQKKIAGDPDLAKMTWTKVEKATCESIGEKFKSTTHTNGDMCDYMEAKVPNKVKKSTNPTGQSTTVYVKA